MSNQITKFQLNFTVKRGGTRTYCALQEHISDSDVEHPLCAAEDAHSSLVMTLWALTLKPRIRFKENESTTIDYIDCELQDVDEASTNLHLR